MYPRPLTCNRPPVVHREPLVHLFRDRFGLELEVRPDDVAERLWWVLQVADHLQVTLINDAWQRRERSSRTHCRVNNHSSNVGRICETSQRDHYASGEAMVHTFFRLFRTSHSRPTRFIQVCGCSSATMPPGVKIPHMAPRKGS